MHILKQSTASQFVFAYMVDATDGYTPKIGITSPLIYISANGASAVVPSDGLWQAVHPTNMPGWYRIRFNASDTSVAGVLGYNVVSTGTRHFAAMANVVPATLADIKSDTASLLWYSGVNGVVVSVGAIVSGVWNAPIASYLSSGSTGARLNAASAAADPWSASPGAYTDPSTFGFAIARAIGGSGHNVATITVQDADDNPLEGVRVDIYKSATPSTSSYVTTGVTNSNGQVTFYLPVGAYYVFRYKRGYRFVDPVALTVS